MINDPEDEAFNDIERQAKQRKEAVKVAMQTLTEYERGYENGFIDGMQKQMQSSVDKAVNHMAQTEQEPPKYSFKAHWEKDGRIGVVAAIVRSDGGVHLLQDIIDAPQRTEQNFCPRCGKRLGSIDSIHTCTPPMEMNT